VAAGCLGVIEDCLTEAIRYAKERSQHASSLPSISWLQEHLTAIEMARVATEALVMTAAEAKQARLTSPPIRKGKNVRIS